MNEFVFETKNEKEVSILDELLKVTDGSHSINKMLNYVYEVHTYESWDNLMYLLSITMNVSSIYDTLIEKHIYFEN